MKWVFTVEAPDGTVEYVGEKGDVLDSPVPWTGTEGEAEDEMDARLKRWSARGDCFVQNARMSLVP